MYNNGDYGASFHYNHHTVTVGQYQGTLMSIVNITYMLTLLVYTKATKIYIFMFTYMISRY